MIPSRARVVVVGGGIIGSLGRLPPGPHGLEGRRAARARPTDVRHDVARRGTDGHVRLDLRDVDRDAQVHARSLRAARGRDRAVDGLQAGRLHRGRDRSRSARGVPPRLGVQPAVRHRRPRDLARAGRGSVPAREDRRSARRLLRQGRRPRGSGRRDDGAREGRAPAGRDDPRGRARDRLHDEARRRDRRDHAVRHDRVRVRRQLCAGMWARQLGGEGRRQRSRSRRPSTTT